MFVHVPDWVRPTHAGLLLLLLLLLPHLIHLSSLHPTPPSPSFHLLLLLHFLRLPPSSPPSSSPPSSGLPLSLRIT